MKKILIVSVSIVSVLLLAVLIVPSFFDWNTQKTRIETAATEALGQPVVINGNIALALLPTPRLKAEGLRVGARDLLIDGPSISASLVDVRVAFWPLLSGKIEAGRVVLRDADIAILTGQQNKTKDTTAPETRISKPNITLPAVDIENAKITFIDAQSNDETTVSEIDLLISAQSVSGPFSIEGGLRYQSVPLALSIQTGNIDADDFPFELRIYAAGGPAFDIKAVGSAGDILSEAPRVEGRIGVTADDLGLVLANIVQNPAPTLVGKPLNVEAPITLENQQLRLEGIQVNLGQSDMRANITAALGGAETSVTAQVFADRLAAADFMDPAADDQISLNAIEIKLPTALDLRVDAAIERVTGLPVSIERVLVAAQLNKGRLDITRASMLLPGGVTATANGAYQTPNGVVSGTTRAALKGANADTVLKVLMGADAALPPAPTPIDLSIDTALEPSGLRLSAVIGRLGKMQISGSGRMGYGVNAPISIRANVNEITIDDWVASDAPSQPTDSKKSAPYAGTLDFDIGVERLRRADQVFQGLTLKGRLQNADLALQSATVGKRGEAFVDVGGTIKDAASSAPRLDLRYSAQAPNANTLLKLAGMQSGTSFQTAGPIALEGTILGTGMAPKIKAKGTLGALAIDSAITLSDLGTSAPKTNGTATLSHPNIASFLAQMGMVDSASVSTAGQPTILAASFNVGAEATRAQATVRNAAGLAKITYQQDSALYDIDLGVSAASLTQYIRAAGFTFDPAGARLGGLDIAAQMAGPLEALTLSTLTANIGPAKLSGTGKLNLSGDVSIVDLRLKGQNLDLAEILPEAETGAQQAAAGTGERWSKDPLELDALASIDGAVTLDLDRLTLRDYELKNARLSLGSEGKRLRIALDKGELFDGPATLTVALDARQTPQLTINMAIKNGDIAMATGSSAAITPLTGTFDLEGAFSGSGRSEYAIVQSLSGNASFSVRDGFINGVDIPQVNERFGALNTINDFLRVIGSALRGGQTAYRLIAVDAVASKGVLTTKNMRTDIDGGAQALLDSAIDLPQWRIRADGSFALEDHPEAPPVGVNIHGPLDNAAVTYQTKKLQEYIGIRLGAAVLKGIVTGEGFGLKDLVNGNTPTDPAQSPPAAPNQQDPGNNWGNPDTPNNAEPAQEDTPKRPEEQIRDLILKGLFGSKNRNNGQTP